MLLPDMKIEEISEMERFLKTCDDGQSPKNSLHKFILPPPWMGKDSLFILINPHKLQMQYFYISFFSFLNIKKVVFPWHYIEMNAAEMKFLSGKGPDLHS